MSDISKIVDELTRWYYPEIRELAEEYLRQPEDERDEWLHETIDGHEFVIYTYKARLVLVATDHPDDMRDELGHSGTVEQQAYFAMVRDVRDQAAALGDS